MQTMSVLNPRTQSLHRDDYVEPRIDRSAPESSLSRATARSASQTHTSNSPEAIAQGEWNRFKERAMPMIEKLGKPSNTIAQAADKEGAELLARTQQQIDQANGRRIGTMTAAQRRHIQNTLAGGAAATSASNSTNARLMQRDINDANTVDAYNYANTIGNQGLSVLTGGTNMKLQREAQNKANSKSFMSSALGMVGTVAGGMIGGPVGASLGGAIGSAVGGGG
jgi:hypothetical protein